MGIYKEVVSQHEISVDVRDDEPGMAYVSVRSPGGEVRHGKFAIDFIAPGAGQTREGLRTICALVEFGINSAKQPI